MTIVFLQSTGSRSLVELLRLQDEPQFFNIGLCGKIINLAKCQLWFLAFVFVFMIVSFV